MKLIDFREPEQRKNFVHGFRKHLKDVVVARITNKRKNTVRMSSFLKLNFDTEYICI